MYCTHLGTRGGVGGTSVFVVNDENSRAEHVLAGLQRKAADKSTTLSAPKNPHQRLQNSMLVQTKQSHSNMNHQTAHEPTPADLE